MVLSPFNNTADLSQFRSARLPNRTVAKEYARRGATVRPKPPISLLSGVAKCIAHCHGRSLGPFGNRPETVRARSAHPCHDRRATQREKPTLTAATVGLPISTSQWQAGQDAQMTRQHNVAMAVQPGAPIFELSVPCEVFGVDRPAVHDPWYEFRVAPPSRPPRWPRASWPTSRAPWRTWPEPTR